MRNALEVEECGCKGASWPRALWSGGLQRDGDPAEQIGLRAGGGEGQTDARDSLDDAGAKLEQPEPPGSELGMAEVMGFGHRIADGEHQPIGGSMEDEADLVGDRRAAAGAVGSQCNSPKIEKMFHYIFSVRRKPNTDTCLHLGEDHGPF